MPHMPHHGRPPGPPRGAEPMEIDLEELARETEETQKLNFITRENSCFSRTEGGFLSLEFGGKKYKRVAVYRAFPFTDPKKYISIRHPDEKAKEIGMIENLDDMDGETVKMLEEQLDIRYFTPIITRVNDIKDRYGFAYFDVVTNKGPCKFTIRNGGGSVVNLSESRLLLSDLDGNRFEVPDVTKLTAKELKKLDLYI